jgi:2-amino-4-hydroxy-6-hydroxymethyldihydropteridine diphosphokinase
MVEALLSLGGNVGDVRTTLSRAITMLCADEAVVLRARSSDYRTAPWGVTDQPAFINLCIRVETSLAPYALLARAHVIERELGRQRMQEIQWGPRPVDIDLLDYDGRIIVEPGLRLPHPRLLERAFVLVPLAEIAAERVIDGVRIGDAVQAIDTAGVERLPA